MWDLTIQGDHDFYVLTTRPDGSVAGYDAGAESVPVLVHNCDGEVYWVKENANMGSAARAYDAGAAGSQPGLAPALQYYKAGDSTLSTIKFDGYDAAANQMIDRKLAVTTFDKTYQQAINQSLALEQNGMTGVWEVPNAPQLARANQIFSDLGITNINGKDRGTVTNLERILAKAFMHIVVSIDLTDDDDIDPDVATSLLEPVAALLQSIAEDDRRALIDLLAECAQDEGNPDRRRVADGFPDAFGLR